jgi:dipeptidyl aminopeptidase/acylaminoacyl peptidase
MSPKQAARTSLQHIVKMLGKLFNNRLFVTVCSALFIVGGTLVAIQFAKGYRPTLNGNFQATGLLAANSFPNGAQVYLDDRLVTATDSTLNLDPGEYTVEIRKDGFTPWRKKVVIEKELVTQTNAVLFPIAPSLSALTYTGASNVVPSPDGQRVVFIASSAGQTKNGLYVMDLSENVLSFQRGPRQIMRDLDGTAFSQAKFLWSPDSSQVLLSYNSQNVLLDPGKMNELAQLTDVTYRLTQVLSEWEEELYKRERTRLALFPEEMQLIATQSARNVYISPDDERLLYTATVAAQLPENIIPPVPAANSQSQQRSLEVGGVYVYDRKEDKNFRIGTDVSVYKPAPSPTIGKNIKPVQEIIDPFSGKQLLANDLWADKPRTIDASPSAFNILQGTTPGETIENFLKYYSGLHTHHIQWMPDSKHLLITQANRVFVSGYDGTNETTIFTGNLNEQFVYPWPDGSQIIILTNLTQGGESPTNLYAINLR